tara:strand:+ start:145 stop:1296 length:1152 start_codon:yes stop_codon:yes gene_type:complete
VKFLINYFEKSKQLAFFSSIYLLILILWYYFFLLNNNFDLILSLSGNENYYFEPFLSLYVYNFFQESEFFHIISILNIVIIPFLTLMLLFKVYNYFIDSKYAFLFSLVSISIFNESNFRDFLFKVIRLDFMNFHSVNDFPLIFKLPFPSFSVLIFLVIFLMILRIVQFNNLKFILITTISSLYFYVNALDSLFILIVWFFYLILNLRKLNKLKYFFIYSTLSLTLLTPGLFLSTIIQDEFYTQSNSYNIVLYNLFPLMLSFVFFYIKRIDITQVWFKFKFIYLLLITEILINFIVYFKIFNIDLSILNKQIFQFMIHLLYYTPIVYYGAIKSRNYKFGTESNILSKSLSSLIFNLIVKYKNIVFNLLIVFLLLYNLPLNYIYG